MSTGTGLRDSNRWDSFTLLCHKQAEADRAAAALRVDLLPSVLESHLPPTSSSLLEGPTTQHHDEDVFFKSLNCTIFAVTWSNDDESVEWNKGKRATVIELSRVESRIALILIRAGMSSARCSDFHFA